MRFHKASAREIRETALKGGDYVSMADSGIEKVFEGFTSLAEIRRVVDLTSYIRKAMGA